MIFSVLLLAAPLDRIDYLQRQFDQQEAPMAAWYYGWTLGYGVITFAQAFTATLIDDKELQANLIVGAASSLIGAIFTGVQPPPALTNAKRLREFRGTPEEKLRFAEQLLRDEADAERFERGWISHLLCFAVSAAQGFVLWFAYKLPTDAIVNAVVSMHIAEAQVWTMPAAGLRAEKFYFTAYPGGLGIAGAF